MNANVPANVPAKVERLDRAPVAVGGDVRPLIPSSFDAAWRFAEMISASGMAPRGMEKPAQLMAAIVQGLEVGMTPMAAVQSIAVVNGRPTIYGDGAIALVRASGLCEYIEERIEGDGEKMVAVCITKRRGDPKPIRGEFSAADAKKAGLWGKQGPWTQYPKRMLQMRSRGFTLRDAYADVLKGMILKEEAEDYPVEARPGGLTPPTPPEPSAPAPAQIEHGSSAAPPLADVKAGGSSEVGDPPDTNAEADQGDVDLSALLANLDEELGLHDTEEDINEAYLNSDVDARLASTEDGVRLARDIRARHFERARLAADKRKATAPTPTEPNPLDDYAMAFRQKLNLCTDPDEPGALWREHIPERKRLVVEGQLKDDLYAEVVQRRKALIAARDRQG